MLKLLKVSSSVLALTLVPVLTLGNPAFAQRGEGNDNAGAGAGAGGGMGAGASMGASAGSDGNAGGQSGTAPGQTGSAPGLAGTTPGQSGATPAQGAEPPGLAGTAPGLAGTTPGQSRRDADTDTLPSGVAGAADSAEQDVTGSVNGSANAHANFGSLISSLNNASAQAQQIRGLTNVGEVMLVDASSLTRGSRANALNNALSRSQVSELRDALSSNQAIANVLAENNISVDDVLSARVMADGQVVVYTR